MKELKNLRRVIEKLNSPVEIEGEKFDRGFNFKIEESSEGLRLYDSNEEYYIDYAYSNYCLTCSAAEEFGFEPPKSYDDEIHEELEQALKKGLGKNAYLEWYDNVSMIICEG